MMWMINKKFVVKMMKMINKNNNESAKILNAAVCANNRFGKGNWSTYETVALKTVLEQILNDEDDKTYYGGATLAACSDTLRRRLYNLNERLQGLKSHQKRTKDAIRRKILHESDSSKKGSLLHAAAAAFLHLVDNTGKNSGNTDEILKELVQNEKDIREAKENNKKSKENFFEVLNGTLNSINKTINSLINTPIKSVGNDGGNSGIVAPNENGLNSTVAQTKFEADREIKQWIRSNLGSNTAVKIVNTCLLSNDETIRQAIIQEYSFCKSEGFEYNSAEMVSWLIDAAETLLKK